MCLVHSVVGGDRVKSVIWSPAVKLQQEFAAPLTFTEGFTYCFHTILPSLLPIHPFIRSKTYNTDLLTWHCWLLNPPWLIQHMAGGPNLLCWRWQCIWWYGHPICEWSCLQTPWRTDPGWSDANRADPRCHHDLCSCFLSPGNRQNRLSIKRLPGTQPKRCLCTKPNKAYLADTYILLYTVCTICTVYYILLLYWYFLSSWTAVITKHVYLLCEQTKEF